MPTARSRRIALLGGAAMLAACGGGAVSSDNTVEFVERTYVTAPAQTVPTTTVPTTTAAPAPGAPVVTTTTLPPCPTTYEIQQGDTSRIGVAERFGLTFEQMDEANVDTPGYDNFLIGTEVIIPCPPGEPPATTAP